MYFVRHFFFSVCNIGFLFWSFFDLAFPNVCICWSLFLSNLVCICLLFYTDGVWSHVTMLSSGYFFFCSANWIKILSCRKRSRKKTEWDSIIISERVHHWKMGSKYRSPRAWSLQNQIKCKQQPTVEKISSFFLSLFSIILVIIYCGFLYYSLIVRYIRPIHIEWLQFRNILLLFQYGNDSAHAEWENEKKEHKCRIFIKMMLPIKNIVCMER